MEIATGLEGAKKHTHMMKGDLASTKKEQQDGINRTTDKRPPLKPCYRCGNAHSPSTCRFINAKCHNSGKLGHIGKVCRSKPLKPASSKPPQRKDRPSCHVNNLDDENIDSFLPAHTSTRTTKQNTHDLYTINTLL